MNDPSFSRYPGRGWLKLLSLVLVFMLAWAQPAGYFAEAQESGGGGDQLEFIRDAEIENYIRSLATPIWRAADIEPSNVTIVIVQSNVINAFVADGMNEFFYTGLLQLADSPEQLAGVIAHETGHIAGGHLIRGQESMRNASAEAILGMILAVAAGAAGGSSGAAAGALSGSQQIAERSFLSFSRTIESSADAAGMSFLDKAGISTRGMLEFFEKLAGQESLPADRQAEYVRTHPLTQDRIENVKEHLENSPYKDAKLDQKFYVMHDRMKAKLQGYLQPETALLRFTDKDPRITARYARAIALYRTSQVDHAIALTDTLIKDEPNNPFFYELKAQIQFENGRIAESVTNYKKANVLLTDSSLLRQSYGHALLETHDPALLDLAVQQLVESNRLEGRVPMTWHLLASAWGRKAELTKDTQYEGTATYALAEEAVARGADKEAGQLAKRAMLAIPKGSPYWLRAQDIALSTVPESDKDAEGGKHEKGKDH
jgi:predicted Zn-dependent protease